MEEEEKMTKSIHIIELNSWDSEMINLDEEGMKHILWNPILSSRRKSVFS